LLAWDKKVTIHAKVHAFSKGSGKMAKDTSQPEVNDALHFAESVRLLWEGTRRVCYGGIDTDQLATLCSIVAGLAEQRIRYLQSAPRSPESCTAIQQLQDYHESALALLAWVKAPALEPDWSAMAESLKSVGAAPLESQE
jgi:hypothetical protein